MPFKYRVTKAYSVSRVPSKEYLGELFSKIPEVVFDTVGRTRDFTKHQIYSHLL
jgi:hypothetical protein